MIRKYHNYKPQTTPWHLEEEPFNHHETPGNLGPLYLPRGYRLLYPNKLHECFSLGLFSPQQSVFAIDTRPCYGHHFVTLHVNENL